MALRSLSWLVPTADELLKLPREKLAREVLLVHLKSYEGLAGNSISYNGKISKHNFFNSLTTPVGVQKPEYGEQQPNVVRALREAWAWLETKNLLIEEGDQRFFISDEGEELIKRKTLYEQLERLGLDRVKSELNKERPRIGTVGGGAKEKDWAWEWVRMKENKPPRTPGKPGYMTLISEDRVSELRALASPDFDFTKLIRLCEELNTAFQEECYFATAMLTRGLLDHVPPVFGFKTFSEVANNYAGGGKSFKETMQHLENAARKVADAHLHMPIRKSETLPTAQQVNCGQQLDMLLSEIVRIMK
jgi:hypothetical protein